MGAGAMIRSAANLAAGILMVACSLVQVAADDSLPTAWRQGIATNYGGAQDGMVRDRYFFHSEAACWVFIVPRGTKREAMSCALKAAACAYPHSQSIPYRIRCG